MTTKTPQSNEGILSFLNSILKKSEENAREVTPEEVAILGTSIRIIAEEVKSLSHSVELLLTAVQQQNSAIDELYSIQEFVLKQLKNEVEDKIENHFAPLSKIKTEKPN